MMLVSMSLNVFVFLLSVVCSIRHDSFVNVVVALALSHFQAPKLGARFTVTIDLAWKGSVSVRFLIFLVWAPWMGTTFVSEGSLK